MKPRAAVIDYGMGNLRSVEKALEHAGVNAFVTDSPAQVRRAAAIVLPGVGAFGEAVRRLESGKLIAPIIDALEREKPFLGICLGLQLLFERSEENPGVRGLGYLRGPVVRFKNRRGMKVPHMGWNTLKAHASWQRTPLRGSTEKDYFYFVHSFFPKPKDRSCIVAETSYGESFCSAVARGRLFASQFHPEKSGERGQRILRNFAGVVASC